MSVKSKILDGRGSGFEVKVGRHNQLYVAPGAPDVPPSGQYNQYRFFSQYLTADGLAAGTSNMNVDGSSTAVEYWLPADSTGKFDIHIMAIIVVVADTAVTHKKFGAVAVLGTGWDLWTWESDAKTYIIEKAKTGAELIWKSGFHHPFGSGATMQELLDFNAADDDAQIVYIPIADYVPGGIRLGAGTRDKIAATINDDIDGLTEMYVFCIGYKHYDLV
jgi:hypothetical protein